MDVKAHWHKETRGDRAPINPLTGVPNDAQGSCPADSAAGQRAQPATRAGAEVALHAGGVSSAGGVAPRPRGREVASGTAPTADREPAGQSFRPGETAEGAFASAGSAPFEAAVSPDVAGPESEPAYAPASTSPVTGDGSLADLVSRLCAILDSRVLAISVLVLLSLEVIGLENILLLCAALFIGYVLADRFVNVRRAVTLGGSTWFVVLLAGNILLRSTGPLLVSIDYLFMFCGFLLALTVCVAFFAGRSLYACGVARGQADADAAIARHMVDRLIEHPDEVGNLDGTYLEVEGALNRVRDRERSQADALRDEARRKDDLVTYLAHDLKTPLASVVGYLSLLEEAQDLPAEQRARFTGIALDKAHRLDALIEEFFDITRFDFHDIVLTRGYVDLSLLLAQVADEFYPVLSDQGKRVAVDAPASMVVLIDGDKMARVFNNVMKNAIAYSYEGSTIRVAATREGGMVTVRFENQGDPIPAPKLNLIFEKFYRLDAARATNRGGAGLGLAIAREIVTAHGGTIACTSTPERTVFTIKLPE